MVIMNMEMFLYYIKHYIWYNTVVVHKFSCDSLLSILTKWNVHRRKKSMTTIWQNHCPWVYESLRMHVLKNEYQCLQIFIKLQPLRYLICLQVKRIEEEDQVFSLVVRKFNVLEFPLDDCCSIKVRCRLGNCDKCRRLVIIIIP